MKVLVINSGSSSIKYELFDMSDRSVLTRGVVERVTDHGAALDEISRTLAESGHAENLGAIGHRVVHGGERFTGPTLIDAGVVEAIRELCPLAPLHNPPNLLGIEMALERRPDVPQVAVFDTAFHHTLPPRAYHYAVPRKWYDEYQVRRYGFHGTSQQSVAKQVAAFLGRPLEELNMIVLHLGSGASITSIAGGKSIDTSMGLTPLDGLVMGTRSGNLDPAVIFHVARESGMSLEELDAELSDHSGLEGLCGVTDMRDALDHEARGDERAALAIDVYTYRIRKFIGAFMAALGRVDAIAFTAGVGENAPSIRARACSGLEPMGIAIDPERNESRTTGTRAIHGEGSAIPVLVVPTNEELEIAEQTQQCIAGDNL